MRSNRSGSIANGDTSTSFVELSVELGLVIRAFPTRSGSFGYAFSTTLTRRPLRSNITWPSTKANKV